MRKTVHRHLGKVVAGTAIAVAGTAVMVAVTLPGTAGADDTGTRAGQSVPQRRRASWRRPLPKGSRARAVTR